MSKLEKGQHSPQASTLNKIARALGKAPSELLAEEESYPKAQAPPQPEPSFEEVTGQSPEERIAISNALAGTIEDLSDIYRDALGELAGASSGDLSGLYMQASLILVGAGAIAEDAGYTADTQGDSADERAAKQRIRDALEQLEQVSDEIEMALRAAKAEQELPAGVPLLARARHRKAS